MLKAFWSRLKGERVDDANEREQEWEQMSPKERAFISEGVDGHAAEGHAEAVLGGGDPGPIVE
jgi:hypothetical protein